MNTDSIWNDEHLARYSRHILLDEIGLEGQEKLMQSTIFVLGCGGLGSATLPYLAASGIGKLIIADDDNIELSNLQRQICYTEADIGQSKAITMQQKLQKINTNCQIEVHHNTMDVDSLKQLIAKSDIAIDCSDNFATRHAMNAAALACRIPLISGSAIRFTGQLITFRFDKSPTACYHCLFGGGEVDDGACALLGVFSPLVGIIGSMQAAEAIKILLHQPSLSHTLQCYDVRANKWQYFPFVADENCPICGLNHNLPEKSHF